MADKKEELKEELKQSADQVKKDSIKNYERLIDLLNKERRELRREVDKGYKESRRYVRSNPEEGLFFAFVGGVALGLLLGRLNK